MPNIEQGLADGQTWRRGARPLVGRFQPYGPHLMLARTADNAVELKRGGDTLAIARPDGTYGVFLHRMWAADPNAVPVVKADPAIPYVNKFVGATGKVETYWRTKELRFVAGKGLPLLGASPVVATEQVQPVTTAVAGASNDAQRIAEDIRRAEAATALAEAARLEAARNAAFEAEERAEAERIEAERVAAIAEAQAEAERLTAMAAQHPTVPTTGVTLAVHDGVDMATLPGGIAVEARHFRTMVDGVAARLRDDIAAVLITGPSGTAKTMMVRAFAKAVGRELITVQGVAITEAADWFGQTILDGTGTRFVLSPFGQALKDARGDVIVLLDEANRAASPAALNAVLSLLDGQREVYVPGYGTLRLPQGMLVVVTANVGAEYVGTVPFDAAVRQRFSLGIKLDYPTESVEVDILRTLSGIGQNVALRMVRMANQQRPLKGDMVQFPSGTGLSTRMLVDAATRHAHSGTDLREVLVGLFDAQFDPEDRKALDNILDMFFPVGGNATLPVDTSAIDEAV